MCHNRRRCCMARRSRSDLVSDFDIAATVFKAFANGVNDAGGGDEDVRRIVTDSELRRKVGELVMEGRQKQSSVDSFRVVVDYTHSLAQMIAAGKYDSVNSDITDKHFPSPSIPTGLPPSTGSGQATKAEIKLELVPFNRAISSNEAIA